MGDDAFGATAGFATLGSRTWEFSMGKKGAVLRGALGNNMEKTLNKIQTQKSVDK